MIDRLLICYFYRQPPEFNESMTLVAIKSLRIFAAISCLSTWFILRSDEIFTVQSSIKNDIQTVKQANKSAYFTPATNILWVLLIIGLF